MRVIAGNWKGRRLNTGRGLAVRPTADRVKEALFAHLADRLDGAWIADLFCGSGGLGIEALSRGARHCEFVDRSEQSLRYTRANLARCGAEPSLYRLVRGDARNWLRRQRGSGRRGGLIVLADPPYATNLAAEIVAGLVALPATCGLVTASIEHAAHGTTELAEATEQAAASGWMIETRKYGNTALTLLRPPHPMS